jgi:hypothetical protein
MAEVMVSIETLSVWRLRMMLSSWALRDSWSLAEMWRYSGNGGRDGSIVTAEEGDDSASKRACRTAESLDVRDGRLAWIVVPVAILFDVLISQLRNG